jgi:TetR/AcrR family transcriptional regulator, cholesterol catabolism regulator
MFIVSFVYLCRRKIFESRIIMDEKLERILRESARLFIKYGIRSLSMDDICRELGISKKTLYQYVDSKPDLISRILQYNYDEHTKSVKASIDADHNAIDILLVVSRKVCLDMQNFNPSTTFDLQKYYPEIFKTHYEAKLKAVFNDIKANLNRGIAEGIYRDDMDVDLVARLYVQKLEVVHNPDFLENMAKDTASFARVFHVMFDNHIRGICNATGLAYYEKQKQFLNFNIE